MNIIRGVFSAILKFSAQLTMSTLDTQASYRVTCSTHRKFKEAAGLLIKGLWWIDVGGKLGVILCMAPKYMVSLLLRPCPVVTKLVQRGYQPHLEDFMLRLNFNGFYG